MDFEIKRNIYDTITVDLWEVIGEYKYDGRGFSDHIKRWQREDLRDFRDWLDYELESIKRSRPAIDRLTWRDIKVNPQKFKACEVCGRIFYDLSRNGRTTVCHYVPYVKWSRKHRRHVHRYKAGRIMSECEVERDNSQKTKDAGGFAPSGSAVSYTASTRERIERQMFVWTSFQPGNEAEEAFVRKIELSQTQYALNGRHKPGMQNASEWPTGDSESGAGNYYAIPTSGAAEEVKVFNVFDLEWSEVVARGLDRYYDEKTFNEKHQLSAKTP